MYVIFDGLHFTNRDADPAADLNTAQKSSTAVEIRMLFYLCPRL